jgi:hypothetical protein
MFYKINTKVLKIKGWGKVFHKVIHRKPSAFTSGLGNLVLMQQLDR